jgi:glycosyltransferase involved in cell wall biosynthesis
MPQRILLLRSNPVHSDPRVNKIAHTLGDAGYAVEVLGWDFTGSLPAEETRPGYKLRRISFPVTFGRGLANLGLELRWQWKLLAWLRKARDEYDLLHACDFDTVLPALVCQRLYGKQVVYDIFDFYADMLRQTPGWLKAAIRWIDLQAINRADAVILADDARRAQIAGSFPRRTTVVYNSPEDLGHFANAAPDSPEGVLRLAYIGLLQAERGLFELVRVFLRHPDWILEFGGSGAEQQALREMADGAAHIRWHGRIPHEQVLMINAAADALIATFDPAIPNHRYSSSNKLFEAMMLSKPVIVAHNTHMDEIVKQYNCGLVVDYGDEASLEAALLYLAKNREFRRACGAAGRQAYEREFDWAIMQQRLLKLYQDLAPL